MLYFELDFSMPTNFLLSLLYELSRWPIMQKVRCKIPQKRDTFSAVNHLLVSTRFVGSLSPSHQSAFQLSFTVLISLSITEVIFRLGWWSTLIQTEFREFRSTQNLIENI